MDTYPHGAEHTFPLPQVASIHRRIPEMQVLAGTISSDTPSSVVVGEVVAA